ncbi:hypothetical protein UFOVP249_37 [uncultured Caudovirales phage]|uniref:DUF7936 domain-containing protein n=1 Tax=uncultured Caudovirales phage TaxID=2100421 RepID=A0A6J5LGX9_9CAUD|nr:hypothetical protein UFOVP249_37 [uncultured Caudovirales phage]
MITWKITQCDRLTADGFITTAHWTATAVDENYVASIYSTCSFAEGVLSIPYDEVTEQDVLNWCWASGVDKDTTESALAAQIELQKNPVQATGVPWSN